MMKLRDYRPEDRAACLAAFDSNIPWFFSVEERERFGCFLDDLPGRYAVICDDDGAVVGCGGLAPTREDPRVAALTWGLVHSSLHGQGYGKALTEGRLAWLADMPEIELVRIDTSHLTMDFYARRGFRLLQRIEDFYQPGLDRCDMELVVRR
ncbi:GNAT family N-acetyltransferase [Polyangium fumosum]|uniref:GNAT family N-acetyltransferase n=2 Tax=Polyangium fumosum TaxID=889272 RepID=A0A4U1IU62_9BACT|nr:GNAT family N-acetyltransferase [Polyangium fumosum]